MTKTVVLPGRSTSPIQGATYQNRRGGFIFGWRWVVPTRNRPGRFSPGDSIASVNDQQRTLIQHTWPLRMHPGGSHPATKSIAAADARIKLKKLYLIVRLD